MTKKNLQVNFKMKIKDNQYKHTYEPVECDG
jgi:hypothetical protein